VCLCPAAPPPPPDPTPPPNWTSTKRSTHREARGPHGGRLQADEISDVLPKRLNDRRERARDCCNRLDRRRYLSARLHCCASTAAANELLPPRQGPAAAWRPLGEAAVGSNILPPPAGSLHWPTAQSQSRDQASMAGRWGGRSRMLCIFAGDCSPMHSARHRDGWFVLIERMDSFIGQLVSLARPSSRLCTVQYLT
jgi:hypothetical protein